jgi:hypothetical protein
MKAPLALAVGVVLLSSCSHRASTYGGPEEFVQVRSRGDLDNFAGKDVAVEGTFNSIGARHASVTLESGLVIYVPHFDQFKKGDDWLKYVGRPVRVEGTLHTESLGIDGISGPVINIRRFEALAIAE